MVYFPRIVDETLAEHLRTFGGVVLQGPRAAGKSETAGQFAASSIRLDADPALAALAETSPGSILDGAPPRLIDEWQSAPNLWNVARHLIDERREPGQFIFTGSAIPTDESTRHSGAGRFSRITLRPMSLWESGESSGKVSLRELMAGEPAAGIDGLDLKGYVQAIVRGGWPALVTSERMSPSLYLGNYLDDVTRVDLGSAGQQSDPVRVGALLRAIARNVATERPATKLALEADISPQSARTYLDALTRVFVLEEQPAWATHLRSSVRVRVQPKWHFVDPSLAVAALSASEQVLMEDLKTLGFLFESLCIRDLRIYAQALDGNVYHYRDSSDLEVDAIVELRSGRWAAIEVKLGGTKAIDEAARSLLSLKSKVSDSKQAELGSLIVLTAGAISYRRDDGVNVVSLSHLHV